MLWTLEINFEPLRIKRKLSFCVAAKMKYEKISLQNIMFAAFSLNLVIGNQEHSFCKLFAIGGFR